MGVSLLFLFAIVSKQHHTIFKKKGLGRRMTRTNEQLALTQRPSAIRWIEY